MQAVPTERPRAPNGKSNFPAPILARRVPRTTRNFNPHFPAHVIFRTRRAPRSPPCQSNPPVAFQREALRAETQTSTEPDHYFRSSDIRHPGVSMFSRNPCVLLGGGKKRKEKEDRKTTFNEDCEDYPGVLQEREREREVKRTVDASTCPRGGQVAWPSTCTE